MQPRDTQVKYEAPAQASGRPPRNNRRRNSGNPVALVGAKQMPVGNWGERQRQSGLRRQTQHKKINWPFHSAAGVEAGGRRRVSSADDNARKIDVRRLGRVIGWRKGVPFEGSPGGMDVCEVRASRAVPPTPLRNPARQRHHGQCGRGDVSVCQSADDAKVGRATGRRWAADKAVGEG